MRKSSNLLKSIWQKVILDGRIDKIATKYRKKIGLPEGGLDGVNTYEHWFKKNIGKSKEKDKARFKACEKFCNQIIKAIDFKYFVNDIILKSLLIDYFFYGSIDWKWLDKNKFSIFSTILMIDGKGLFEAKIDDGIYIKIGPYSTIDSVLEYVDKNRKIIKSAQDGFLNIKKLPLQSRTKLSESKNFERDNGIEFLNQYSLRELKEFGGKGKYKESVIASLIEKYAHLKITSQAVKKVLSRRKHSDTFLVTTNSPASL